MEAKHSQALVPFVVLGNEATGLLLERSSGG
jgi:hypothetical protein